MLAVPLMTALMAELAKPGAIRVGARVHDENRRRARGCCHRAPGPAASREDLANQALPPAALDICAIQAAARRSISAGATSSTCWARPHVWPKGSRTLA